MAGVRGGVPGSGLSGALSLTPAFVPWAAIATTLLLIASGIAWLLWHGPMKGLLRRSCLGDPVALWIGYAALYHLVFLDRLRTVLGRPLALWGLCAGLGLYVLVRRLPTPLRRPDVALGLAVLLWAALIAAGQRYVQDTAADAERLATEPQAVVTSASPDLRPLWRALLLSRLPATEREATAEVLAMLQGATPVDDGVLSAYRIGHVPRVLEHYRYDLAKLRTYQWLQIGLLAATLLVWGFGHLPEWDTI